MTERSDSILPESVRVGSRHRKDLGDLAAFARDIDAIGLLQPIVVTPEGELIAGARRLAAWALTSHAGKPIPCHVVDLDEIVRGEASENMMRKAFTPSEAVAIAEALRPLEEAAAAARMKAGKRPGGKLPQGQAGKVRDIVAKKVGLSGRTLDKMTAVVAAERADPVRFGKLKADMDRTGRANGPYRRLIVRRKADAIKASPPPFPNRGPYYVAAVDVPWLFDDTPNRGLHKYPTMTFAEVDALGPKVRELMHADSVLWFWTTNFHLLNGEALRILAVWGFEPKGMVTWDKEIIGHGDWLRDRSEHVIMAVRGEPVITITNQPTILREQRREESEKPEGFYSLVEKVCPAPRYLEMFQRKARPNWDGYGDEAGQ